MTRAAEVAAALERWTAMTNPVDGPGDISQKDALQAGDTIARLLREAQPEPAPVGGEDEALIREANAVACILFGEHRVNMQDDIHRLVRAFRRALADVARLTEERDSLKQHHKDWQTWRSRMGLSVTSDVVRENTRLHNENEIFRAALATAEEAKAKAVEEEREACRMIAANYALNCVDSAGRFAANTIGERIRARAGRNDAG